MSTPSEHTNPDQDPQLKYLYGVHILMDEDDEDVTVWSAPLPPQAGQFTKPDHAGPATPPTEVEPQD